MVKPKNIERENGTYHTDFNKFYRTKWKEEKRSERHGPQNVMSRHRAAKRDAFMKIVQNQGLVLLSRA